MSKKKDRRQRETPVPTSVPRRAAPLDDREVGLQAFTRSDYTAAIVAWTRALAASFSEPLTRALAEAYFRRACTNIRGAQALDDLQAACNFVPDDPVYLYHRGLAYHRRKDYAQAIESYRESIRSDPFAYARAAYAVCLAVADSGGNPAADPAWELLIPAQRNRFLPQDHAYMQAVAALTAGNFASAEAPLHQALNSFRGFAHYYLGVITHLRGANDEALAHWLAARVAGFDAPVLRHNLLVVYTEKALLLTDSPDLLETVRAGLRYAPDSPILQTLRQRGEFLNGNQAALAGDWRLALNHWEAARQTVGKQALRVPRELLANIALACERLDRWTDAADAWRELIRRRPRHGENAWSGQHIVQLWRHTDTLYARAGRFSQSVATLRYAIKAQPDDLTLRLALVKRQVENENWRGAETAVLRVLEMKPGYPEALALYAQILDMGDDLDLMIDTWEQVARSGDARHSHPAKQRLITLYPQRADFYLSVGDSQGAATEYLKAIALSPQDALLRARYGAMLIRIDPQRAREQFEAVTLAPNAIQPQNKIIVTIVSAWHATGNHAEAARWLTRLALATDPLLLVELGAEIFEQYPDVAHTYFDQAVQSTDGSLRNQMAVQLLTTIGVIYAAHHQTSAAHQYAQRALRLDPKYGPAHLNLGLWDAGRGRRQAAQDHLLKALEWAQRLHRSDISEGIEEALNLLEEHYTPTLNDVLDTIDPDGSDTVTRRLLGSFTRELVELVTDG